MSISQALCLVKVKRSIFILLIFIMIFQKVESHPLDCATSMVPDLPTSMSVAMMSNSIKHS